MTTTSTVLQIKEATLALSRTVPCTNITVSMVIQKSKYCTQHIL